MSFWLTDPELFLYAKGTGSDDVHLWRCKKTASSSSSSSSLVVPMKPDDFDYVSNVNNHQELIEDLFVWDENDYKRLVKYIFERRLLVNNHGFVIAELHKVNKDGNKMIGDGNEEVPPIYIRSLDVLPLKPYIPMLRERPIPLRIVQYLEDVDGKAAVMEEDDFNLAKKVADLELKNKTLEDKVTKLTADIVTLQYELDRAKNGKEVWMNDLTNSSWVGVEGLNRRLYGHENFDFFGKPFTTEDIENGTNVRAAYLHKIKLNSGISYYNECYKAVSFEDLFPNKEKARFSQKWYYGTSQGKAYAIISNKDSS